jgi:hypothetical protein
VCQPISCDNGNAYDALKRVQFLFIFDHCSRDRFCRQKNSSANTNASPNTHTSILSREAFTQKMLQRIKRIYPDLSVQYFAELILQSKDSDSAETRMDLTHAYTTYQQSPESLERLIKERLDLMKDQQSTAQLETKDIIPVIKDRQWHEGLLAQSKLLGGKDIGVYVEDFVGDLIVIYAEDRPSSYGAYPR